MALEGLKKDMHQNLGTSQGFVDKFRTLVRTGLAS